MDKISLRPAFHRSIEFFRCNAMLIAVPAIVVAVLGYAVNFGFSALRHSLITLIWRHYWVYLKNQHFSTLEVVPIGFLIQTSNWFVTFYLWAFAFAVIALIVQSRVEGGPVRLSGVPLKVLSLGGLPALLWQIFWRLALTGYLTMASLSILGVAFYRFVSAIELRYGKEFFNLIVTVLIFFPFFLYARRFLFAIPILAAKEHVVEALDSSKSLARACGWRLLVLSLCLIFFIGEVDRLLPSYLFSIATLAPPWIVKIMISVAVSVTTGLLWSLFFVFLTHLASENIPPAQAIFPEEIQPVSM